MVTMFQTNELFAEEQTLYPTNDAYVVADLNDPEDSLHIRDLNTGDLEFLKVWYGLEITENNNSIFSPVILKFDLPSFEGSEIESTTLRLYVEDAVLQSGSNTVSVYQTEDSEWDENQVTYNTAPVFREVISRENIDSLGWHEWEIPNYIIKDSTDNVSFTLSFENLTRNTEEFVVFSSKEGSEDTVPNLVINTFPRLEQLSENSDKLYPSDDAYVIVDYSDPNNEKNFQNVNTGLVDFLRLSYAINVTPDQSQFLTLGYLKFDLSEIDTEKIESVTLKMKSQAVQKIDDTIAVDVAYVPGNDWSESNLTFVNRPMPDLDSIVTSDVTDSELWTSWDVTNFVNGDDLSLTLGLNQLATNSEELATFYTKENKANAPHLEIKYSENGGGCLIATAAYGSEMAPQVQFLREIRDNQLMNTASGVSFITGFNQFYYSFSPTIADLEREYPLFKEAVKVGMAPLLSSLSIMQHAESESEILGYGISVIVLNIGMYFVLPIIGIVTFRNISKRQRGNVQ